MQPLPVGTKVYYHGSHVRYHGSYHGMYIIQDVADRNELKLELVELDDDPAYIDGVAYDLWPAGVDVSYRHRDQSLHFVPRSSITKVEDA